MIILSVFEDLSEILSPLNVSFFQNSCPFLPTLNVHRTCFALAFFSREIATWISIFFNSSYEVYKHLDFLFHFIYTLPSKPSKGGLPICVSKCNEIFKAVHFIMSFSGQRSSSFFLYSQAVQKKHLG